MVQNFTNKQNDIAKQDPINHHLIVVGDMNFRYADKPLLNVETSKFEFKEPKLSKPTKTLLLALNKLTRIEHDNHTHFNAACKNLSDIDHIYLSSHGWQHTQWQLKVQVGAPEKLFEKKISDHAPFRCSFSFGGGWEVSFHPSLGR